MDIREPTTRSIQEKLSSGAYADANEVVERALDALDDAEISDDELRCTLEAAVAQLDRGESVPAEKVFAQLQAKYEVKRSKSNK